MVQHLTESNNLYYSFPLDNFIGRKTFSKTNILLKSQMCSEKQGILCGR